MTALAPSSLKRRLERRSDAPPAQRSSPTNPSVDGVHRVEVIVPDPECAALFLQYAAPVFPAELVAGVPLLVRLQPPRNEPRWVIELLSLVERWLESAALPCANVLYGGRSYLIRAPIDLAQLVRPATVDVATPLEVA